MSTKGRNFGRTVASPQDPTKVPSGIDNVTYFAPLIPEEIKEMIPLLHTITIEYFQQLLETVITYLQGVTITEENLLTLQRLNSKNYSNLSFNLLLTGLYLLISIAIRQKVKNSTIKTDLLKMNVPSLLIDEIIKVIRLTRFDIESYSINSRISFPRLIKLRWRVDVIISSGSLSRVLRPIILMQMILSNKVIKTFEVSIEQFSQLRLGVAKVTFFSFPSSTFLSSFLSFVNLKKIKTN